MSSSSDVMDPDAPSAGGAGASQRLASRRRRMLVGLLGVAVLYLLLTWANPRAVPRLSVLPEPPSRGVWFEACNDAPGNRHEERWESSGLFWTRTEFHTLAGCIDQ